MTIAAGAMIELPLESKRRIAEAASNADFELQHASFVGDPQDVKTYLSAVIAWALAVFDAEAKELIGCCEDIQAFRTQLEELAGRITERILPDQDLRLLQAISDHGLRGITIEQDITEFGEPGRVWEYIGSEQERTFARKHVQGWFDRHGVWENLLPWEGRFLLRFEYNKQAVRSALNEEFRHRISYRFSEFPDLGVGRPGRVIIDPASKLDTGAALPSGVQESARGHDIVSEGQRAEPAPAFEDDRAEPDHALVDESDSRTPENLGTQMLLLDGIEGSAGGLKDHMTTAKQRAEPAAPPMESDRAQPVQSPVDEPKSRTPEELETQASLPGRIKKSARGENDNIVTDAQRAGPAPPPIENLLAEPDQSPSEKPDSRTPEQRRVEEYLEKASAAAGQRIRKRMFHRVLGYSEGTALQAYMRCDPNRKKNTPTARQNFESLLAKPIEEFLSLLVTKRIIVPRIPAS
jgi:hypothetical protein